MTAKIGDKEARLRAMRTTPARTRAPVSSRKGGTNAEPSQITKRPPPPAPMRASPLDPLGDGSMRGPDEPARPPSLEGGKIIVPPGSAEIEAILANPILARRSAAAWLKQRKRMRAVNRRSRKSRKLKEGKA